VFVQVNTSGEASKYGLVPHAVADFLQALPAFPALRVRGLMTLALFSADVARVRPRHAGCLLLAERQSPVNDLIFPARTCSSCTTQR